MYCEESHRSKKGLVFLFDLETGYMTSLRV